ncbi:MAG TPA: hypothetical protein VH081_11445 [Solirubrobacteraceae bacterium]|jgi:hypothetical protein|nr:hypothetical protein [Solirubrobacteraceae bacterium]
MPLSTPTNNATLIGKLTRDPQLRRVTTRSGEQSVLTLGLAVRRAGKQQEGANGGLLRCQRLGPTRRDLRGAPLQGTARRRLGAP